MAQKPHPERCHLEMVRKAKEQAADDRARAWSRYIIIHYNATGNLAPGCDARDFYAAYDTLG
jgi:hypothetical protein